MVTKTMNRKKKIIMALISTTVLWAVLLYGGGSKEEIQHSEMKSIRIAEQVPGLITPGSWDGQAFSLNSSMYEYLVEISAEDGSLVPVLATSWESLDGFKWEFKLREGVFFHDGTEFTSDDVKYTIERTQDPSIGHLKKQDFSIVESIQTPDKYTVVINLRERRPTFIYQMTDYNMAILSSSYDYATYGESKPMGTGPFKLSQLVPKESALLEKNAAYWNEGLPKVDRLLIYFVPDIDGSISMLESGQVDIVPFITPEIQKRLENNERIRVVSPYQEQRFISMAADRPPFSDNLVRLAFKYAMDPEILARSTTHMELGEGVFYDETPIMNKLAEHIDLPLRIRDVGKARQLLTEAGYPDGLTVPLYYASDHPFGKELAQTIQELAKDAGINIELKGFTRDIYLSQYWLDIPLGITGWGGRIDPSMLLSLAFRSDGPWNESHISDSRIDALIDAISSEVDSQRRLESYRDLQKLFYEEGTLINLQVPYLVALSTRIIDYRQPLTMIPQYKYTDIL